MISKKEQYGYQGIDVKGITFHNTGNSLSAKELFNLLETTNGSTGCHFLVDENEVIEVMPVTWCAYHTGKGKDWGNDHTIAIEICRSQADSETYFKAQERAVHLARMLMVTYGLDSSNIYFHKDFSSKTYCPHKILDYYGNKKNFIQGVF